MEEEDWNLQQDLNPSLEGLQEFARSKGGELNDRPLWLVLLCRTCREQGKDGGSWILPCTHLWWRNLEYDGPIPPLRNPATELVCSALTRTAEIKERMRVEAEARCGELEDFGFATWAEAEEARLRKMVEAHRGQRKLREFVMASLFPPWAEGAEAGLKEQLAKMALDQVNWWEVRAALGMPGPNYPDD